MTPATAMLILFCAYLLAFLLALLHNEHPYWLVAICVTYAIGQMIVLEMPYAREPLIIMERGGCAIVSFFAWILGITVAVYRVFEDRK